MLNTRTMGSISRKSFSMVSVWLLIHSHIEESISQVIQLESWPLGSHLAGQVC